MDPVGLIAIEEVADLAHRARGERVSASASIVEAVGREVAPHVARMAQEVRTRLVSRLKSFNAIGAAPSIFRLMGGHDHERPYNCLLSWLLNPSQDHDAGRALLHEIARRLPFPELMEELDDPNASVEVLGEMPWPRGAASSREPDLLILTRHCALLIENKVWSGESGRDQYTEYLNALERLAVDRGLIAQAWLMARDSRPVPDGWAGFVQHSLMAEWFRAVEQGDDVSLWGRILCLMGAAALDDVTNVQQGAREARHILELTRNRAPLPAEVLKMMQLTSQLEAINPITRGGTDDSME